MSNVGFKGFAKPKAIDEDTSKTMVSNVSADEYVLYTGGQYRRRRASGRSACLATVTEKMRPITLSTYAERCLKAAADGKGYGTDISVGGLGLHQGAKPCVYLHLVKDPDGNFRAKKDIPNPDRSLSEKPFAAGDIVIPAGGNKLPAKRSKGSQQAAKK